MLSRSATTTRKAQEMLITVVAIIGCLLYPRLVNMTRPGLAFAYSHLSKFVQYAGIVHSSSGSRRVYDNTCGLPMIKESSIVTQHL
jgi:hypothetical protein